MARKLTTILLGTVTCLQVYAQRTDAMLFGDVKSAATGEHIPYASITVKGTNLKTMADATGHFKLTNLPVGQQTIIATAVGYKSQEILTTMVSDKGTEVYFVLDDDARDLNQVVVTGTRTRHFVKNVPVRTEVITAQALTDKNAQNVFEALEGVPGMRVEQQCQA